MGHHLEAKKRQQNVHLSIGPPPRGQSNGNKSYIMALRHHLEAKAWGTTWKPRNGNKTYILAFEHHPLRDQSNGNKSYILALGHHFAAEATTTNRTSKHLGTTSKPKQRPTNHTSKDWGTTWKPKQRQQIVHQSIGPPLGSQSNGNKTFIMALGHHFETKATAANRTSKHWATTWKPKQWQQIVHHGIGGITSKPKQRQQIVHLGIGAPLRSQKKRATNRIS